MSNTESCAILRNCFTCRFRYRSLRPDEWGGYPWRCSAKGGIKIGSGQDRECPQNLWEPKKEKRA